MSNHKVTPQVKIISKPENMLQTIYTACRTCYSADSPININESESANDPEKALKLVKRVISSGHYSTIEHIQVSYAISGISRACSHQFVRHRLMSFSQKSQRYVQEKDQFDYIVPTSVAKDEELAKKYDDFMAATTKFYIEMTEKGIKAEDARMILPNATATSMVASLNLRLCTRAQAEIRTMVKMMCDELIKTEPWLKEYLVPKCEKIGFCDEDKSCGRKAKRGLD